MREGEKIKGAVPSFDDGSVLTIKYLHELEDSVKTRTPLAGRGISITRTDEGAKIGMVNGVTCQYLLYSSVTLNVCSNGEPDEITVLKNDPLNTYTGQVMFIAVTTRPLGFYDKNQPLSYLQIDTTRR
jgi:hypothetical protein